LSLFKEWTEKRDSVHYGFKFVVCFTIYRAL